MEDVINMVSGYLYYYCLTLLADEEKAKDAVQDIFLTIIKKINSLSEPKAFLGWVKTIASNYCKTKLTRTKENFSLDEGTWELADESGQVCPSKSAETNEACACIREAVRELPQILRESVLMFYFNQMSVRQIADVLEVNESTVKSRLYSARQTMKKYLEKYGGAALAGCSIPPLNLISFSLIQDAECQKGILIPFVTQAGEVKVAAVNPVAVTVTFPVKAAAITAACALTAGGIGVAASTGMSDSNIAPAKIESTASYEQRVQSTTVPFQIESTTVAPTTIAGLNKNSVASRPDYSSVPAAEKNTAQNSAVQNTTRATTAAEQKPQVSQVSFASSTNRKNENTQTTSPQKPFTSTLNIVFDEDAFGINSDRMFCVVEDLETNMIIIDNRVMEKVGNSNTWKYDFAKNATDQFMRSGAKYSVSFHDGGAGPNDLIIESFDISKTYTAVFTGKFVEDEIGESHSQYKWA